MSYAEKSETILEIAQSITNDLEEDKSNFEDVDRDTLAFRELLFDLDQSSPFIGGKQISKILKEAQPLL
jgi:hypothetical protein